MKSCHDVVTTHLTKNSFYGVSFVDAVACGHLCFLSVRMRKLIGSREELRRECQELSSHLDELESPVVFCHNDIMPKNIVYSEAEGM